MNVTQCDVCGNIVKNEQIMALNVYRVRRNSMNSMIAEGLCTKNYARLVLKN